MDHGVLCTNVKIPNMCAMYHEPCMNGVCINMAGNDYRCDCNPGFIPSADLKACTGEKLIKDSFLLHPGFPELKVGSS